MGKYSSVNDAEASEVFTDPRLGEDLLWRDLRREAFSRPAPALFLDRDGVMIEEKQYIKDPDQVKLLVGVTELIRTANEWGMAVIEVTNQAGIARGYLQWNDFVQVEERITQLLLEHDANIQAAFACPFNREGQQRYRHPNHPWRKPNPGMLLEAARLLNLDLRRSTLIGDKTLDIKAAQAAGLDFAILVSTGYGKSQVAESRAVVTEKFSVEFISQAHEALPLLRRAMNLPENA
jgi:D-glycero-D-manno-heptose 1,7-bisphosphate phosphatase